MPSPDLPRPLVLAEATFSGALPLDDEVFQANFQMAPDAPFSFVPGQYVWIVLPVLKHEDPRGNRRAFSIINGPSDHNSISVLTNNTNSGFKKTLLGLHLGDRVRISGPFGSSYVINPQNPAPRLLLAINSGVAPFLSLLRHARTQPATPSLTLIHYTNGKGFQKTTHELQNMTESNSKISVITKQSRISWSDVPPQLQQQLVSDDNAEVFVSGGQVFVDQLTSLLLNNGVQPHQLHYEEFYPNEEILTYDQPL